MGSKPRLKSGRSAAGTRVLVDAQANAESRLRAIIEATPECVKLVDPEGRVLEMNEAGLRMIDCDHIEDIVGRDLAVLIIPEDRATWMRNHKRVCSGESLQWEFPVTTLKGRVIIVESNAVPMTGPDGRLCQLAVTRDITEQRARLVALSASEHSLSQAIKATGLGIFVHDHVSGRISISPEMREIVHHPEHVEPTLDYYIEMIAPEDRDVVRAAVHASHDPCGDGSLQISRAILSPEGERRWLEVWAQTTFVGEGKQRVPENTIGAVRDVTDDHKLLEDLRESEAKWRNLFNSMQEGFIVVELIEPLGGELPDFRIVEANAQWEEMTGIPLQQVLGKPVSAAIPGLEERWFETYTHVARTGEAVTLEQYAEALERWFEVRVYAHSPGKFAAVFLNITERKLAQAAAEEARQEKVRASRLTAMGAMASTLAHELNQPLATSTNFLGALLMQLDGGQVEISAMRDTASKALEACLRAGEIIRRTRSFTMEGKVMRHREGLASMVEESASDFRRQAIAAGVEVKIDPPPEGELLVECDRVQIEQVFSNLLRNAAQAMRDASDKRIIIRLAKRGQKAVALVEDSGPGFDPDTAERIFNPFSSSKKDGLGLGLALCRTIIEAHGGTINGVSRSQGGAVFEVSLPASA